MTQSVHINQSIYLRLAQWINEKSSSEMYSKATFLLAVCGAQGSGKTTLVATLKTLLETKYQRKVLSVSLDDFYLSRAERAVLAETVHPLLKTRGVPGTHDVSKALRLFETLKQAAPETATLIPRFDKATDNPFPPEKCDVFVGRPDIILFEGWCVGVKPQPEAFLQTPVNDLERLEDADGCWRKWVNRQLSESYQPLWAESDALLFLRVPSFDKVYEWRLQQERDLASNRSKDAGKTRIMSPSQLKYFIGHYERLTEWSLLEVPKYADMVLSVGEGHHLCRTS